MADFMHLQEVMGTMRPVGGMAPSSRSSSAGTSGYFATNGAMPPPMSHHSSVSSIANPEVLAKLEYEPFYVGHVSQSTIEKAMSAAPAGNFVVRKSDKAPNVFVLMVKLSTTTGMQKRIVFSRGVFVMEIDGAKRSHTSLATLLLAEPSAKRPARAEVEAAARKWQSSSSQKKPHVSTKKILEQAMTEAEDGNWHRAIELVKTAKQSGASAKNIKAASEYIKSFIPAGASTGGSSFNGSSVSSGTNSSWGVAVNSKTKLQNANSDSGNSSAPDSSPPPLHSASVSNHKQQADTGAAVPSIAAIMQQSMQQEVAQTPVKPVNPSVCKVTVQIVDDDNAKSIGLLGRASCEINSDRELSLQLENQKDVDKRHIWPLPLLRRYGKQGRKFYFEAGRRCVSGAVLIHLDMSEADVIRLFDAADHTLDEFRQEEQQQKNKELEALRKFKAKVEREQKAAELAQAAAMEKYKKEAEEIARRQLEEREKAKVLAEEQARKEREAAEKAERIKQEEQERQRIELMQRRKEAQTMRQARTDRLSISKTAEKAIVPQKSAASTSVGIGFTEVEEWGKGKSKIWKALNPRPLAYQTAKDRREASDKISIDALGQRGYTTRMQQVTEENLEATNATNISPVKKVMTSAAGMETHNVDVEEEDFDDSPISRIEEEDEESLDASDTDDDSEVNPESLADFDEDFEKKLSENRAQRAAEEENRQRELRESHERLQREKQAALDKELAIIAATKKLEREKAEREADAAIAEAQKNAAELVFDFTFG